MLIALITERHGIRDAVDLEQHIHCLETQAYSSILKAFVAQSDLLTWVTKPVLCDQVWILLEQALANCLFLFKVSANFLCVAAGQRGAYDWATKGTKYYRWWTCRNPDENQLRWVN